MSMGSEGDASLFSVVSSKNAFGVYGDYAVRRENAQGTSE
jgi:hypothetical protein